MVEIRK